MYRLRASLQLQQRPDDIPRDPREHDEKQHAQHEDVEELAFESLLPSAAHGCPSHSSGKDIGGPCRPPTNCVGSRRPRSRGRGGEMCCEDNVITYKLSRNVLSYSATPPTRCGAVCSPNPAPQRFSNAASQAFSVVPSAASPSERSAGVVPPVRGPSSDGESVSSRHQGQRRPFTLTLTRRSQAGQRCSTVIGPPSSPFYRPPTASGPPSRPANRPCGVWSDPPCLPGRSRRRPPLSP